MVTNIDWTFNLVLVSALILIVTSLFDWISVLTNRPWYSLAVCILDALPGVIRYPAKNAFLFKKILKKQGFVQKREHAKMKNHLSVLLSSKFSRNERIWLEHVTFDHQNSLLGLKENKHGVELKIVTLIITYLVTLYIF